MVRAQDPPAEWALKSNSRGPTSDQVGTANENPKHTLATRHWEWADRKLAPQRDSSSVKGAGMGRTDTEAEAEVDNEEVDEVKTVGEIQPHGTNEEEENETRGKEEQGEVIE